MALDNLDDVVAEPESFMGLVRKQEGCTGFEKEDLFDILVENGYDIRFGDISGKSVNYIIPRGDVRYAMKEDELIQNVALVYQTMVDVNLKAQEYLLKKGFEVITSPLKDLKSRGVKFTFDGVFVRGCPVEIGSLKEVLLHEYRSRAKTRPQNDEDNNESNDEVETMKVSKVEVLPIASEDIRYLNNQASEDFFLNGDKINYENGQVKSEEQDNFSDLPRPPFWRYVASGFISAVLAAGISSVVMFSYLGKEIKKGNVAQQELFRLLEKDKIARENVDLRELYESNKFEISEISEMKIYNILIINFLSRIYI
jgi:hypothetical protein